MQAYLLSAIRDMAVVGKYSNWHINSTYSLGYSHPETIRLAYMSVPFLHVAAGPLTGLSTGSAKRWMVPRPD
jgi:hypothetical protein